MSVSKYPTPLDYDVFEEFRLLYKGSKRGLVTEMQELTRHKDWRGVLPLLVPALKKQIEVRDANFTATGFNRQWANLKTYLYNRGWEEEIPLIEAKQTKIEETWQLPTQRQQK